MRSACKRDPQRMTAAGCRLDAEDERERFGKSRGQAALPLALSRRLSRPDNRLESSKRIISAHGFARLKLRAEEQSMSRPQRLRIR